MERNRTNARSSPGSLRRDVGFGAAWLFTLTDEGQPPVDLNSVGPKRSQACRLYKETARRRCLFRRAAGHHTSRDVRHRWDSDTA
jgi:hypothetical protein